jgi:prepilin-type N-terminal cleavage/methylation domain-containing protein
MKRHAAGDEATGFRSWGNERRRAAFTLTELLCAVSIMSQRARVPERVVFFSPLLDWMAWCIVSSRLDWGVGQRATRMIYDDGRWQ